ncbi:MULTISPECIES: hypothetical protein [unclassified Streptomyces]|uniref:hypothetical protein n=1 Tax=unclassified Streptomyces TaxID=2593676 RepID=UPI002E162335|nr:MULTISPECIES: hypothetical protein [unclassified Streptomyces]WSR26026.1 hypothetical protein OG573_07685 [Streptomyces sp. NBC_01205]
MDAALTGLAGTTVGALAGFAGAWLAQRGQLRQQREQRAYAERVRWLDDKKGLYRDLLIAMYGWHDSLVSIWLDEDDGRLSETRGTAYKWGVEASLIASEPVQTAIEDLRGRFLSAQSVILSRTRTTERAPLEAVQEGLALLESALRAELSDPHRPEVRRRSGRPWGVQRGPSTEGTRAIEPQRSN